MHAQIQRIQDRLPDCLLSDQPGFRRRLGGLKRRLKQNKPADRGLKSLAADVEASAARRARRGERMPVPTYPEELPVTERREAIKRAIAEHPVVVVAGETGSGKTTQLPKLCLELGRGAAGMIGHTQPRRIAARSVAARIASELRSEVGHAVGYQVRFTDRVGADTYIKLMTDGILLAETQGDPDLLAYDTLIVDEAHERSLNIDFLLGYLKRVMERRPDLKLIITSATIDTERFAEHFNAPVVEVSGRTYPVEMRYRPLATEDPDEADRDLQQAIVEAVDELAREGPGDCLVFLPGEREIREAHEALRKHHPPETEILPLFARLSVAEQNRIFQPTVRRRIVLATNVAETSLTVPGIHYVVDTGVARTSRYSHRSKIQRLPVEKISRASADQRAGRCGRVAPGVCIRLYGEDDYLQRPAFTEPEIQRTNLASVILRMLDLGLGEVESFPFVDAPQKRYINDGYRVLQELGAADERRRLTRLGRELARLPVDPRIGRMILAARERHCLREMLIIASALAIQDPRERPMDAQEKADAAHARFKDDRSDFLALLNVWNFYHEKARHRSNKKLRQLCHDTFLAYRRMREWHDLQRQLANLVKDMAMKPNQVPADYESIHGALLSGLLSNVGLRETRREYQGSHGKRFRVFPGSSLAGKPPKWVVAAEMVETSCLFAHTAARVEPEWVERAAGHLVKRSYFEPHWERRAAKVAAYEQVTLFGLVLVGRRKVNYGPVNPAEAREIFIRRALVEGDYDTHAEFFRHNRALVEEINTLEDKSRRRDILVDEQVLYQFYDERLPADVCSGAALERWRKEVERTQPRLLFLGRDSLMRHGAESVTAAQYPDALNVEGLELSLAYHFEPGHEADGVTVTVPLAALNSLRPERFQWLVPALLEEKLTELIKSLPKSLRRNFVPAPDFARACAQAIGPEQGELLPAVARQLKRMTGVQIAPEDFEPQKLPPHLVMRFEVADSEGNVLEAGRDLEELQQRLGEHAQSSLSGLADACWERDRVEAWDFGELPESIEIKNAGITVRGFPALVDENGTAALRLFSSPEQAQAAMGDGLCRLFMACYRKDMQYLRKNLPGIDGMCMRYAPLGGCEALKDDLVVAAVRRALLAQGADIRTRAVFEARAEAARGRLVSEANALCELVARILDHYHSVAKSIDGSVPPAWLKAAADIREQLHHLVYPGFVRAGGPLGEYPRYLKAIARRLERLDQDPARDRQLAAQVQPLWQRYLDRAKAGQGSRALEEYRWMVEELRVSLFAQELGTAQKVSVKRLESQWQAAAR